MPTRRRNLTTSMLSIFSPSRRISPSTRAWRTVSVMRFKLRKKVDFPQPEGPITAVTTFEEISMSAIGEIINNHVADEYWRALLHRARDAAEHGGHEMILMRFPSDACSDGGRAINGTEPGWPATLRGEATELYLRWEHELKPRGFGLSARVLDFPSGMPGDIGLFLSWVH